MGASTKEKELEFPQKQFRTLVFQSLASTSEAKPLSEDKGTIDKRHSGFCRSGTFLTTFQAKPSFSKAQMA
jgi:hypothetical protein